jgi:hypothetical protein
MTNDGEQKGRMERRHCSEREWSIDRPNASNGKQACFKAGTVVLTA